jgi:hypothetical protein
MLNHLLYHARNKPVTGALALSPDTYDTQIQTSSPVPSYAFPRLGSVLAARVWG